MDTPLTVSRTRAPLPRLSLTGAGGGSPVADRTGHAQPCDAQRRGVGRRTLAARAIIPFSRRVVGRGWHHQEAWR